MRRFAPGALTLTMLGMVAVAAQEKNPQAPVATFSSSVDLVRVNAVVRDKKGRFVTGLTSQDFEVFDGGIARTIVDFRRDEAAVSVAMLFDISGSMEGGIVFAREAATHLLNWLKPASDEAAVYTFSSRLDEVQPFTAGLNRLPEQLSSVRPFGATSLHDAIAETARRMAERQALRRAVIVFTDGRDTASRLTPGEVSGIASSIDVPVYIIGVVPSIDNPLTDYSATSIERSALTGSLSNLAYWTGGDVFIVSTISERSLMARKLVDELRHQFLIAFESSDVPGWRPIAIRMRDKDLTVRARSGYIAGRSRPISH